MKVFRDAGQWNLVDQQGLLVCRGTLEQVKQRLQEYWP